MWNGYSESETLIKGKINFKKNNDIKENQKNNLKNKFLNKISLIIIISFLFLLFSFFIIKKKNVI